MLWCEKGGSLVLVVGRGGAVYCGCVFGRTSITLGD
jgi:hypothetical protein